MMDEPLGALDAEFRERMAEELRALHDRMNATTVYVTHDQLEAMQMGDKIVIMNHGVVEQFGTPQDIYDAPASIYVADFVGSPPMNFLDFVGSVEAGAEAVEVDGRRITVPALREDAHGALVLGVRPEHVVLADDGVLRGEVLASEYLGTTSIVTVDTPHGAVKARVDSHIHVAMGEHVGLDFRPAKLSVFDRQSGRSLRSALNETVLVHG